MGNASGRSDGESTSSAAGFGEEGYAQGLDGGGAQVSCYYMHQQPQPQPQPQPMLLHSPPQASGGYLQLQVQPPLIFNPQVALAPLSRPGNAVRVQNYGFTATTTDFRNACAGKARAVMITWSYDGKKVAVTGSWDNWTKREPLQRSGTDFSILKMLPPGVYHYRFIVDEQFSYAPGLPWECDNSGTAYNVLDVQEYVPDAPESLFEFESPASPPSSYGNESLDDYDFGKPPPEIPPQLQSTLLNSPSPEMGHHQSLERPRNGVINHLYIQSSPGRPVALGSTHRFLKKYVTVVLYKPSRR